MSKCYARKKPKNINIKRLPRDLNARWEHLFGMSSRLSIVIVKGLLLRHTPQFQNHC
jgi:hypothetical protein